MTSDKDAMVTKIVAGAIASILSVVVVATGAAVITQNTKIAVLETHKDNTKEDIAEIKESLKRIERYLRPMRRHGTEE